MNSLLSSIAKPTVSDRKMALRKIALSSEDAFLLFLATVKEHVSSYDPNIDALGYYKLKDIFSAGLQGLKHGQPYNIESNSDALMSFVSDTIEMFKRHVEKGNLWEELWINGMPKKEGDYPLDARKRIG